MIIHQAGLMLDYVQLCVRCGYVLNDYRNAAWPTGQPAPSGWAPGAHVEVEDRYNPKYAGVTLSDPTCEVKP